MNLKSYLRGIGAGLIVAALVMGISMPKSSNAANDNTLYEKQTIKESSEEKENSVEKNNLEEVSSITKEEDTDSIPPIENNLVSNDDQKEDNENKDVLKKDESEDESLGTSDSSLDNKESEEQKDNALQEETPALEEKAEEDEQSQDTGGTKTQINPMPEDDDGYSFIGEVVEIRVIKGDSSVSVSRRLYEAGLVESAVEFDKYLCSNGYDKYICVGTFDIPMESDFETMAKILTKRN